MMVRNTGTMRDYTYSIVSRPGPERSWERWSHCFASLCIDHQIELGGLLDRGRSSGFAPLIMPIDVPPGASIEIGPAPP